jgi:hypothetical protein
MDRNSIHDQINASYTTFERAGRKFIQVDSYGPAEQEIPGKRASPFSWTRSPRANCSTS